MKRIQGKQIIGYSIFSVEGNHILQFFQRCSTLQIPIWYIQIVSPNQANARIFLHHIKIIEEIAKETGCHITIKNKRGLLHHLATLWKRKVKVIAIICSILTIFLLTNFAWKVQVKGVSTEMERKILEQLKIDGLFEGAWASGLPQLDELQENLIHELPELLYVGIKKNGTIYTIDAVEKLVIKKDPPKVAQHIIATKNGTIHKMMVKEGQAMVAVNDYVRKGETLITGVMEQNINIDKTKAVQEQIIVAAEGNVYANTWYEVNAESSLNVQQEKLTGDNFTTYYLGIGSLKIPIWGIRKMPYKQSRIIMDKKPITIMNKEIPIYFLKKHQYDLDTHIKKRTVEEAKNIAITQAVTELNEKIGKDAQILKYYILHEATDSGKVKLKLYISALENIAVSIPID